MIFCTIQPHPLGNDFFLRRLLNLSCKADQSVLKQKRLRNVEVSNSANKTPTPLGISALNTVMDGHTPYNQSNCKFYTCALIADALRMM